MNNAKKKRKSNRMRKTRDLVKKIRNTIGTFNAKIGTIKDRNGMDITEATASAFPAAVGTPEQRN